MQNTLRILIVEDDPTAIKVYEQQIDFFNSKNEINIIRDIKKDREEGLKALTEEDYDAAIIDIKLSSTDPEENGNEIVRKIKKELRFPVRVYTAFEDLDTDLLEQNEFYKIYKRTGENSRSIQEILNELVAIYKTGITKILGKRGIVEGYLKEIFWKHLSGSFSDWIEEAQTENKIEKILLRYTLSHLQEYLDKNEAGGFDEYHPMEVYIIDPVNNKLHTGMILKQNASGEYYIILTPSCDIANENTDKILLCKILQDLPEFSNRLEHYKKHKKVIDETDSPSKKQREKYEASKDRVMEITRNSFKLRYHYLPKADSIGCFVDFQDILVIGKSDAESNYEKKASVTNNFRKEIVSRFSHYYMRQGQPCFIPDKIFDLHT